MFVPSTGSLYREKVVTHNIMSTWNKLILHPQFEQIKTVYNDQFPIEVRFVCAHWIEQRMKTECIIDINHPQIKEIAADFLQALIQQILYDKQQLIRAEQLSVQCRLDLAIEMLRKFLFNPFPIYKQIRDTISYEEHSIGNIWNNRIMYLDEEAIEITRKLNILKNEVLTIKEKQRNYTHVIENYKVLEYREMLTQTTLLNDDLEERRLFILDDLQLRKNGISDIIKARSIDLNQRNSNVIFKIDSVQKLLICNRLSKWHRDQALAGNGASLNQNSLDEIQLWFEKLAEIIWTLRCTVEGIRKINNSISLSSLEPAKALQDLTALLQNLIKSAFIVEKQPTQVLRTEFKFSASVRLLTPNLGIELNNPSIFVSLYLQPQSVGLSRQNCEILNNTGKFDIQPATHHLCCTFNNMKFKLKKSKRTEKQEGVKVTEEKYALIFKSTFRTADLEINVSVTTLPIVIIVHLHQEPLSWGTITWDNAFSIIGRQDFYVPDKVSWSHLADVLNMKFTSETNKSLSSDAVKYLCEKAFGANVVDNNKPILWNQFCKVPLPGRKFTFWEWFYSIMQLIRNHVQSAWTDGSIIGFIDRRQTIEKLQHCRAGTFLLRFSESELGGISIAVTDKSSPTNVVMLEPFFSEGLKIRPLADRIQDLDQCVTLYPNTPKDEAFKKHYTQTKKSSGDGYVRVVLKATIPDATSHACICKENDLQLDIYEDPAELFDFLSS